MNNNERMYDNPVDVVVKVVEKNGKEILRKPVEFSEEFSAIAPNLEKYSNIFRMVLAQGIGEYFIESDDHYESVEKATDDMEMLFSEEVTDMVIDAICKALGWEEEFDAEEMYQKGTDYFNKYDDKKAFMWFEKAAKKGYADAQNQLAVCYEQGEGLEQNYKKAVEWYEKAAEQGHAIAQNNLGFCYDEGKGVEQNYKKAVEWYEKAAEQRLANAQNNLGFCYENGQGVEQDYKKAVEWYEKAAEQGFAIAQSNLAVCYEEGRGVEKDLLKAACLYVKAYENGNEIAEKNLRNLLGID